MEQNGPLKADQFELLIGFEILKCIGQTKAETFSFWFFVTGFGIKFWPGDLTKLESANPHLEVFAE